MSQVTTIGLDIAKNVFHAHGADERGAMVFSRKLTRAKLLDFFAVQPACVVALEACGGAHHWARQLQAMGHEVRLIPPAYVKPFVKRNKNDAIDAEAICEAAQRPGMRFVAVKSEEQQAAGLVFRTRDLVVRQRTQLINAIRGHLAEYGWVAPRGTAHMTMLADLLEDEEMISTLPEATRPMFKLMVELLADLDKQIAVLDREIARRAKEDEAARRLMTIPASVLSPPLLSSHLLHRSRRSARAGTSLPGSGLRRGSTRPAASSGSAVSRRWESAPSGGYSSSAAARWYARLVGSVRRPDPGWSGCSRASRACSSRSRSPTRWRAWSGRCSPGRKITELRRRSRRKPRQQSETSGT